MNVARYDSDLVRMVEGKVSVDEDLEVGDRFGEREAVGKESPCMWVRVEYDGQKGWRRRCARLAREDLQYVSREARGRTII